MGTPYYKIIVAGTDRALAATADGEVVADSADGDSIDKLWRIDQLTDGTYRISPKAARNGMALVAVGASTVALAKFDPSSDTGRWTFKTP
jgi:arabinan endo-1,5-alpha-L-arabinosidase